VRGEFNDYRRVGKGEEPFAYLSKDSDAELLLGLPHSLVSPTRPTTLSSCSSPKILRAYSIVAESSAGRGIACIKRIPAPA
jgi:hypothetical protein